MAVFLFHGGQKSLGLFGGAGWNATLEIMAGLGIPTVLAVATIFLEIAIVPLLLLGFLTRLAALIGCMLMAGSLYFIHGGSSFPDLQAPLLILACSLALFFQGGGGLSLDHQISRALLPPLRSGGLRLT